MLQIFNFDYFILGGGLNVSIFILYWRMKVLVTQSCPISFRTCKRTTGRNAGTLTVAWCRSSLRALISRRERTREPVRVPQCWHTSGLNFESWEQEQWKQENQEKKTGAETTYLKTFHILQLLAVRGGKSTSTVAFQHKGKRPMQLRKRGEN